jgi:hypothetical protein
VPIPRARGRLAFFSVGSERQKPAGDVGRGSELLLQVVGFNAYAAPFWNGLPRTRRVIPSA